MNPDNNEDVKTIEIYIYTKDSITIKNLVKIQNFTPEEYFKMNKDMAESSNPMRAIYASKELKLIDENNININLSLAFVANEDGKNYAYYKTKA